MPRSRTALVTSSIKKYNAAYSAKKDFVARPNAFLKQCLERIAPKRGRHKPDGRKRLVGALPGHIARRMKRYTRIGRITGSRRIRTSTLTENGGIRILPNFVR